MAHEEVKIENLPYSPLNEDASSLAAGTVNVQLDDNATVPSNDYKFTCKTCCCGKMSLRCGCILIAALYTLYSLFYIGLIITFLIMLDDVGKQKDNYAYTTKVSAFGSLYYASIQLLIAGLLSYSIKQKSSYYLHVTKWIMIVEAFSNLIEIVLIPFYGDFHILYLQLTLFLCPLYLIWIVHCYEAQLFAQQFIRVATYTTKDSQRIY